MSKRRPRREWREKHRRKALHGVTVTNTLAYTSVSLGDLMPVESRRERRARRRMGAMLRRIRDEVLRPEPLPPEWFAESGSHPSRFAGIIDLE